MNKKDIIKYLNEDNIIINDSALVMHEFIDNCKDVELVDSKSFSGSIDIIDGYKVESLEDVLSRKRKMNNK